MQGRSGRTTNKDEVILVSGPDAPTWDAAEVVAERVHGEAVRERGA
jgi:hypothetical protein